METMVCRIFSYTAILLSFICILVGLWHYKATLLGIDIFFVPSNSMAPTLLPGQFILVDTWRYQSSEPEVGDVVVFPYKMYGKPSYLVKRLAPWPAGVFQPPETPWFVLGDNSSQSRDSRYFGGVSELYAPVTHILFRWDGERLKCPCWQPIPQSGAAATIRKAP
jgi:signal peptidase I